MNLARSPAHDYDDHDDHDDQDDQEGDGDDHDHDREDDDEEGDFEFDNDHHHLSPLLPDNLIGLKIESVNWEHTWRPDEDDDGDYAVDDDADADNIGCVESETYQWKQSWPSILFSNFG